MAALVCLSKLSSGSSPCSTAVIVSGAPGRMRKGAVVTTRSPGERPESTSTPPNWRVPKRYGAALGHRLAVLVGDDPDEILVADRHHRLFGHHQGLARTLLQPTRISKPGRSSPLGLSISARATIERVTGSMRLLTLETVP